MESLGSKTGPWGDARFIGRLVGGSGDKNQVAVTLLWFLKEKCLARALQTEYETGTIKEVETQPHAEPW